MGNASYTSAGAGGERRLHRSVSVISLFPPFLLLVHAQKFSPLSVAVWGEGNLLWVHRAGRRGDRCLGRLRKSMGWVPRGWSKPGFVHACRHTRAVRERKPRTELVQERRRPDFYLFIFFNCQILAVSSHQPLTIFILWIMHWQWMVQEESEQLSVKEPGWWCSPPESWVCAVIETYGAVSQSQRFSCVQFFNEFIYFLGILMWK